VAAWTCGQRAGECELVARLQSLAVVVFGLWQHESSIFAGVGTATSFKSPTLIISLCLIVFDLVLLFHSSSFVLPVYALTAASVHYQTPDALLEFAKKRGIRPDLVALIEEADAHDAMVRACNWQTCLQGHDLTI
jgi:hypothetical protein